MEVREAEGVVVTEEMGVVTVAMVVVLVVMAGVMVVMVVTGVDWAVEEKCVFRSRCNQCPEGRLSTPNQGRRHHIHHCCRMRSSSQRYSSSH